MQLVKVRFISGMGESKDAYSYYSEETLRVGDMVKIPARGYTSTGRVVEVDVPEIEIAAFKDRMKVIPAGSVIEPVKPLVTEHLPDDSLAKAAGQAGADIEVVHLDPVDAALVDKGYVLATMKVKPENDPAVLKLFNEAVRLRDYALARKIESDSDLKPATEDLSIMARVKKALGELKAQYVKPIRGHLDDINAAFTKIMTPLEEADNVTRGAILAYREAARQRQLEADEINRQKVELARREATFNEGEITINTTPVEAPPPVKRVSTDMGTASVAKLTTWELVDFALVPDQYKMLDSGKITKLVKAGGAIPGIKVVTTEGLRVTTR